MPVRICHLITDLDAGGAERTLVNLTTGLDRARFESEVVTLIKPGIMAGPLADAGIPVTSLHMRRGRPSLAGLVALVRHLRRTRPTIVQTWLYHADLAGTIAGWFTPPHRLVWNIRCSDMTQTPGDHSTRWLLRALALLSRRRDAIVVNSTPGRRFHEQIGYRPKQWAEIPNGVDVRRFRPRPDERSALRRRLGLDPAAMVVGFVARFHPMKDHATFLRAAARFAHDHAAARFVLCGEGLDPRNGALRAMIEDLGLGERAVLLGTRVDMEDIYSVLDMLALCSVYGEGFPNVLVEAMACGVPCVSTDVGASREIVADDGVIVPARDPEALARGWETLFAHDPAAVGARARARVTALYSLERMGAGYEALYESLLRPPTAPRPA